MRACKTRTSLQRRTSKQIRTSIPRILRAFDERVFFDSAFRLQLLNSLSSRLRHDLREKRFSPLVSACCTIISILCSTSSNGLSATLLHFAETTKPQLPCTAPATLFPPLQLCTAPTALGWRGMYDVFERERAALALGHSSSLQLAHRWRH